MTIRTRNNVNIKGHGTKPMIFAHGFGCGQAMWREVWPAFEKDYQIILFDYVGSGHSDINAYNSERYASLNGYAMDLLEVMQELNLKDAVFVGHSVSCMVGILASIKYPEYFESLVLIGPSARYINDAEYVGGFEEADIQELLTTMEKNYIGWANYLAPAIMGNPDQPELGQELTESFCSTDPVVARQFAEVTFLSDNRADLQKVRHRSLVLQCAEDLIAPLPVGQYIKEHIDQCSFQLMKATGHCPHLSAPEETIRLMKDFLA
ncbi:sigma-B regulation protein RsbQ [Dyadobacter jejuensis]|uniref:Sigma-B regulation protein RsbQ n=1 Tax=Dyadobacter jejuensis TaxID=1082580 RepID=A0A316AMB3_9BACT|nr:alpha/beta hydrolase [Dyadobacter jejuensis]PWJ58701.1 sigma-B regulation protein RsbQ [Dyadobacter jejuensis]